MNKAARTLWRLLSDITTAMPSPGSFKTARKMKKWLRTQPDKCELAATLVSTANYTPLANEYPSGVQSVPPAVAGGSDRR